jgi:opacity protein-like surface antigen
MKLNSLFLVSFFCLASNVIFAQRSNVLIPDFAVAQYAGSIGYASIGFGYSVSEKSRLSLHYGKVPACKGGPLDIIAAKFFCSPYTLSPSATILIKPVDLGFMVTYHFGDNFYTLWLDRYPDGYYWWSSSTRFHLALESAVTYLLPNSFFKSITGYVEFNTNDLYMVSFVLNHKTIGFLDIVKAGAGVRIKF